MCFYTKKFTPNSKKGATVPIMTIMGIIDRLQHDPEKPANVEISTFYKICVCAQCQKRAFFDPLCRYFA